MPSKLQTNKPHNTAKISNIYNELLHRCQQANGLKLKLKATMIPGGKRNHQI
jgi:hypothetical protein